MKDKQNSNLIYNTRENSVTFKIMYSQDINQNKFLKHNPYSTLTPLSHVLKLFGLCWISTDGKGIKYSWPSCKVAFLTALLFIATFFIIYFSFLYSNSNFQRYFVLLYALSYTQYIVDLTFVSKYGRQRCLDYYSVFENIDKVIGMPYYSEIKQSISKICLFFMVVSFCYFISDFYPIVISHGWIVAAFHTINYIYTAFKVLSALDGIAHFTNIRFRLKRVEDILQDYYRTIANLPGVTKDVIVKNICTKTGNMPNNLNIFSSISSYPIHPTVILHLSKCYLLVLKQCDYTNDMFGFRALFGSLVYLLEMVMLINLIIRLQFGTLRPFYNTHLFSMIPTTMKILSYSLILVRVIHCCQRTYKQAERIVRIIDHLLINKKLTLEAEGALKELRGLLISRPVSFNAVNFYTLDYPTMLAMASAVVTYTIILLQNMQ